MMRALPLLMPFALAGLGCGEDAVAPWLSGRSDGSTPTAPTADTPAPGPDLPDARPPVTGPDLPDARLPVTEPDTSGAPEVATTIAEPPPGRPYVEVAVGPAGGHVEVPGALSLRFAPGTLEGAEWITVRPTDGGVLAGRFFALEASGGEGLFPVPVQLDFALPPGRAASDFMAVQEIAGAIWQPLPAAASPPGILRVQVSHFSKAGIVDRGRTWAQGVGATIGAGGGTLLLIVAGAGSAPVSGPMLAFVLLCGGGGWLAGGDTYDSALFADALGPIPIDGFALHFDGSSMPAGPRVRVWVNKLNGRLLAMTDPQEAISGRDQTPTIGPPGRKAGATITLPDGSVIAREVVATFPVPVSVLYLGRQLQQTRRWYADRGYATPETTPVLITRSVATTRTAAAERNAGEWLPDAGVLLVKSDELPSAATLERLLRPGASAPPVDAETLAASILSDNLRATLAHEFLHALYPLNHLGEVFPGAEEAAAVAFESLVCPDSSDFLTLHGWSQVALVLRSGLTLAGAGEDHVKRGYGLWPWMKYWWHQQGDEELRQYLRGQHRPDVVRAHFRAFCRHILVLDDALADPAEVPTITGASAPSRTGWRDIDLKAMAAALGLDALPMGRQALPATRPASLTMMQFTLPAAPTGQGRNPVVVRRYSPLASEELAILRPTRAASGNIVRAATREDVIFEEAVAVVPAWWFDSDEASFLPVALIGAQVDLSPIDLTPLRATDPNPLLVYRLTSPEVRRVAPIPVIHDAERDYAIAFEPPRPGRDLLPQDVLAGYRLLGRSGGGAASVIGEYVFDRGAAPHAFSWWYQGASGARVIEPAGVVTVRGPALTPFDEIALVSMDARVREGDGPLCSAPIWRQWRAKEPGWVLVDTRVVGETNPAPITADDAYGRMTQSWRATAAPGRLAWTLTIQFERAASWKPRSGLEASMMPSRLRSEGGATLTWTQLPEEVRDGESIGLSLGVEKSPPRFEAEPAGADPVWMGRQGLKDLTAGHLFALKSGGPPGTVWVGANGPAKVVLTPPPAATRWEIAIGTLLAGPFDHGQTGVVYVYERLP